LPEAEPRTASRKSRRYVGDKHEVRRSRAVILG
jgi:hypothetical protein